MHKPSGLFRAFCISAAGALIAVGGARATQSPDLKSTTTTTDVFSVLAVPTKPQDDSFTQNDIMPDGALNYRASDALPLDKYLGAAAPAADPTRPEFAQFFDQVRDDGLPEPASWALMMVGFGMIGGVIRGFVVANRRLAKLQSEDSE